MLARRVAAGALVVLAGVATLRSNPDGDRAEVVVAVRDLRPGTALTSDHVRLEKRLATTVPDGSQPELATVVGSTLASPTRRGEMLTMSGYWGAGWPSRRPVPAPASCRCIWRTAL